MSTSPAILNASNPDVFRHASRIATFFRATDDKVDLPTETFAYEVGKRAFDLALAIPLLPMAAGLIASISLALAATSGGPVLYRQRRIGRRGQPFTIWKFRTMHADAGRILREHLKSDAEAREEWDQNRKLRRDPRITPLGKILRETAWMKFRRY